MERLSIRSGATAGRSRARTRGYASTFVHWEQRASVRTKPRRTVGGGDSAPLLFPPELVPATEHPLVRARGPAAARRILAQSLYAYLDFTVVLEQSVVLPVTSRIALGRSGLDLPRRMRSDAFKITTDEAYHAQFCHEFVEQLAEHCGIPVALPDEPQFAGRVGAVRDRFDPALHPLLDLVFVTVSETLVSAYLSDLPGDRRLPRPVRDVVGDHAEDEGRHHAYFRAFLRYLWPQLSERERRLVGPHVPDLVEAFLEPDLGAVTLALRDAGLDEREAATVVGECYRSAGDGGSMARAARATVLSFRDVGALDDPATHEAFAARGLVG